MDDESSILTDCRTEMGTKPTNVRVWTAHHQILLDTWLTAVLVALLAGVWTQAKVLHPFFSMARQAALQFLLEWKRAILSTAVAVLVVFGLFAVASRRRKR
jgi:di/tricarboxylate transporter